MSKGLFSSFGLQPPEAYTPDHAGYTCTVETPRYERLADLCERLHEAQYDIEWDDVDAPAQYARLHARYHRAQTLKAREDAKTVTYVYPGPRPRSRWGFSWFRCESDLDAAMRRVGRDMAAAYFPVVLDGS